MIVSRRCALLAGAAQRILKAASRANARRIEREGEAKAKAAYGDLLERAGVKADAGPAPTYIAPSLYQHLAATGCDMRGFTPLRELPCIAAAFTQIVRV